MSLVDSPSKIAQTRFGSERDVRTIVGVRTCDCGIQGPESLILALADRLAQRNVRYIVANLWDGDPPTVALHEELVRRGHQSHILRTSFGMSPATIPMLANLLKKLNPDIVHTHDVKAEIATILCRILRRRPLVGSYYGRLAMQSPFLKLADLARFPIFRWYDRVLANSSAQLDELRRFRVRPKTLGMLPSFVSTQEIRPAVGEQRRLAREALSIPDSARVMATIAKLAINKGHTYMLQAMPEICKHIPNALYLIAGEGDVYWRGEGGIRQRLEEEARRLGVVDNVRFLGYVSDLKQVLHATDLAVSPSLLEGMQVAVLETMAAGLPIVATAIGGTPDAVADGETGCLVPPQDPQALAKAIVPLLADDDRLKRMGIAARKRAETCFETEIVVEQFLQACAPLV